MMDAPEGYSWMRRVGAGRSANRHLLPSEPQRDPSTAPDVTAWMAACGAASALWVHPLPGMPPCEACMDASQPVVIVTPYPEQAVPTPPESIPEGVAAQVADFGPLASLNVIQEGDTPLYAIVIVAVLDADNDQADRLGIVGTVTVHDACGSLDGTKFRLWATAHGLVD